MSNCVPEAEDQEPIMMTLMYQPVWLDVPLIDDYICTVMAHSWHIEDGFLVFKLLAAAPKGMVLPIVRLPASILRRGVFSCSSPVLRPCLAGTARTIFVFPWDLQHPWRVGTASSGYGDVVCSGFRWEGDVGVFDVLAADIPRTTFDGLRFPRDLLPDYGHE